MDKTYFDFMLHPSAMTYWHCILRGLKLSSNEFGAGGKIGMTMMASKSVRAGPSACKHPI